MTKASALKLIADFEHAVREHSFMPTKRVELHDRIQGLYDFEHTRLLTKLTEKK